MMLRNLLEESQNTWIEILKDIASLEENSLPDVSSIPWFGFNIRFTDADRTSTSTVAGVQNQIDEFYNDVGIVYVLSKRDCTLTLKKYVLHTELVK